jgi:hypothetical protein
MNAVWIIGGLCVAGALALVNVWRRGEPRELGTVSSQWLAEYRQAQES